MTKPLLRQLKPLTGSNSDKDSWQSLTGPKKLPIIPFKGIMKEQEIEPAIPAQATNSQQSTEKSYGRPRTYNPSRSQENRFSEREKEKDVPIPEPEIQIKTFDEMKLKEKLLRGIFAYGFESPSRIQQCAVPVIIEGKDIIAQSQAGTGKTGAFTIGTLNMIDETKKYPQAIIMSNTRELAEQINHVVLELGKYLEIKTALSIGGVSVKDNIKAIKDSHVIVGTPGRLKDLMEKNYFDISKITVFVIDEADELLQRDFLDQTKCIINFLPEKTQICIFSATLPEDTLKMTKKFMQDPVVLLVKREELTLDSVAQYYINVGREEHKLATIADLYNKLCINQSIIYVNSVNRAKWLEEKLQQENHIVGTIHGKLSGVERSEVMKDFRNAKFRVLIATDLMGRGIDVQQVSYVINYDLPSGQDPLTPYIHRIGRSGRYGRKGVAINLVTKNDYYTTKKIERQFGTKIVEMPEPDVINSYLSG